jgi:hypothetical protein
MVPLDGSPLSRQALGIAAGIAPREDAALHLVATIAPLATPPTEAGSVADKIVRGALGEARALAGAAPAA